jgi:hypothetical protein
MNLQGHTFRSAVVHGARWRERTSGNLLFNTRIPIDIHSHPILFLSEPLLPFGSFPLSLLGEHRFQVLRSSVVVLSVLRVLEWSIFVYILTKIVRLGTVRLSNWVTPMKASTHWTLGGVAPSDAATFLFYPPFEAFKDNKRGKGLLRNGILTWMFKGRCLCGV